MKATEKAPVHVNTRARRPSATVAIPKGITIREALFLLGALARVKEHKFGRLGVTVGDGRVVDIELTEKIDRRVLQSF